MKKILLPLCLIVVHFSIAQSIQQRVDSLMKLLTLEEKVGQLNQYTGNWEATGPAVQEKDKLELIKRGKVGSMLNVHMVHRAKEIQALALQSPRKIPLLFGLDVIHGYKTVFPLPLAEAASWDLQQIELSSRIAATEAAASGVHWTFAPMVDISRDARWGRVMEGAGEDAFLGSKIAVARVKGFQGKGIGNIDAVMACVKHFAAYGAAIAGRDYNTVDISEQTLHEVYLPPFKAAVQAGAASFMNAFNEINGIPATAHGTLVNGILKKDWNFKGIVVSDWGSIHEMIPHGYAANSKDAAEKAIMAGNDMDMESRAYKNHLANLVKENKVPISVVNNAVKRILTKKFELGLFDNPYKFMNEERQQKAWNNPAHKQAALAMAERSIVLLKNDTIAANKIPILPLANNIKNIALIGPLAHAKQDMQGFWCVAPDSNNAITVYEALQQHYGNAATIHYNKACNVLDTTHNGFATAIQLAKKSDVVIVAVGEHWNMTGEAKSRGYIGLPGVQEQLIEALHKTGKPIVVLVMAGRPLIFEYASKHIPAIVNTWLLGDMAGTAIVNVLTGKYNPSAKLPMTFPKHHGQLPIFYAQKNTGRPSSNGNRHYTSAYIDIDNTPAYAFGHGLSYTKFAYSNLQCNSNTMQVDKQITVSCTVTNTGTLMGEEVVQLYLHDKVASITRPVKELKGFEKVKLLPGETKKISFTINNEVLQFYSHEQKKWIVEKGVVDVFIGSASNDIRLKHTIEVL
jgi:beta-glucosidase